MTIITRDEAVAALRELVEAAEHTACAWEYHAKELPPGDALAIAPSLTALELALTDAQNLLLIVSRESYTRRRA